MIIQMEAFDKHVHQQQQELEQAGFSDLRRIKRNNSWKTYWRARSKSGIDCFVKCFYGYAPEVNTLHSEKEARLSQFWQEVFGQSRLVHIPCFVDQWQSPSGTSYVTMEWVEHLNYSIHKWVSSTDLANLLLRFLNALAYTSPPPWWDTKFVLWGFDGRSYGDRDELIRDGTPELSPFGFDLVGNLGIDKSGRLVFKDYTYVRWESRWLQHVHEAMLLLVGSFGYFLLPLHSRTPVTTLLAQVPRQSLLENLELDRKVLRIRMSGKDTFNWRSKYRLLWIRKILFLATYVNIIGY